MDPYSSGKDLLVPAGAQCQASSIAHEQYGSFGTSGAVIFEGATGVLVALGYAGRVERAHVAYCIATVLLCRRVRRLEAAAPPIPVAVWEHGGKLWYLFGKLDNLNFKVG